MRIRRGQGSSGGSRGQRPDGYNVGLFQNGFGGGKLPGIGLNGGTLFQGLAQDAGYVPNGPVNSNPSYTYRDNVSKSIGKHNLQFGAYFVASQKNELPQFEPSVNGFITYDAGFSGSTGDPFADLLAGNISSFGQASGQPKYYLRYKIEAPIEMFIGFRVDQPFGINEELAAMARYLAGQ